MNIHLSSKNTNPSVSIQITGSKSESNRLLLLQSLYPQISIDNISNSDDSEYMQKALKSLELEKEAITVVDIHHAGTAMRFLTAFFSIQNEKETVLTGSKRMKERPIKILVDALRQLGANISYENEEGYPPIRLQGKTLDGGKVTLAANVSSQYISALLLIGGRLKNGIELHLEGKITSVPYIKMTLALLEEIGLHTSFAGNVISVQPKKEVASKKMVVESDWSSASYFYSIAALSEIGSEITLSSYKQNSLQGDSVLAEIYRDFGVETSFQSNSINLKKTTDRKLKTVDYKLDNAPDIAQTIAVTCLGLGIACDLHGLHTLPIKETDRLAALKTEIEKLGGKVSITAESLHLRPTNTIKENIAIDTYQDHRMAMAFAPLAYKVPITINEAEVVSKSYPDFWKDMGSVGIKSIED
ncbi:3-phosphoshikimate 1-carboxyvinyltransferase [Spongiivirga citrea]|uniref:3-phosphoshikimate 1-carboxyvinyltransferase n=1 Tax=Spongiivirga citrea TaxID=1481457 RepID=A0A6M0CSB9_9FLAO|nr:3-phosphoshikimate 1-carboxyvinyltransferase [Spongiivirga citrea]NER18809.1 3-phosphoshikimate 1-carboxyvinyltransferase [Spongiivirga citrea]